MITGAVNGVKERGISFDRRGILARASSELNAIAGSMDISSIEGSDAKKCYVFWRNPCYLKANPL
jgi:hypothetical protein